MPDAIEAQYSTKGLMCVLPDIGLSFFLQAQSSSLSFSILSRTNCPSDHWAKSGLEHRHYLYKYKDYAGQTLSGHRHGRLLPQDYRLEPSASAATGL